MLLHHEVEVEFPESKRTEKHSATLLEFGEIKNGQMTTAMAKTVGIPAAIGALVLTLITVFRLLLRYTFKHLILMLCGAVVN